MSFYKIWFIHIRMWSLSEILIFGSLFGIVIFILYKLVLKSKLKKQQAVAFGMLFLFLGFVYASTVFTREIIPRECRLILFWSWRYIFLTGDKVLLQENLLNCILLFPMGVLLPAIADHKVKPGMAFVAGICVSAFIECSQLIFMRGLFEWDDMIHNALGCMCGCIFANFIRSGMSKINHE